MSLFRQMNVACASCGATVNMSAVGSINADRRPDLRAAILDGEFQDETCAACGEPFRLQPEFNYLDMERGQWIAGLPADRMPDWIELEDATMALFRRFYGDDTSAATQELGRGLAPRLTFGWPAVREKILARQHGIDDAVLEMLKLETLRRLPSAPLAPGTELRLAGVADDVLTFTWIDAATEAVQQELGIRRTLLDAILGNAPAWSGIRAKLTDGPFVDMQKLYMGAGRDPA